MSLKQLFLATSTIALLSSSCVFAQTAPASGIDPKSPVTHGEFSAMLKDALMQNPEMIVEAIKGMQAKQKANAEKEVQKSIEKYSNDLFKDTTSPSIGDAKQADVTLVEFFDYHCGYCKRMLPSMTQLNKEDPKVHIIFREFPILSEDSSVAARAALAVNHLYPDKYFAFHTALMSSSGEFNDKTLSEIAGKQGLDWKKISKEMDNPDIKATLEKTRALADELGVRGTPALVMGNQLIPGAVPYDELKKMVDNVRAGKPAKAEVKPEASH